MRRIISQVNMSLDGYVEGPGGALDWLVSDMDEAVIADAEKLLRSVDTILLGRVSYDGFSQFWPHQSDGFASLMNTPPKVVFSRSGEAGPLRWGEFGNARRVAGDPAGAVRALRSVDGGDMALLASAGLVQSFTARGLIDEYQVVVHPVVLGGGKPLFADVRAGLELVEAKPYPTGSVRLTYRPA
jgi:dihydrofolate reductase